MGGGDLERLGWVGVVLGVTAKAANGGRFKRLRRHHINSYLGI